MLQLLICFVISFETKNSRLNLQCQGVLVDRTGFSERKKTVKFNLALRYQVKPFKLTNCSFNFNLKSFMTPAGQFETKFFFRFC